MRDDHTQTTAFIEDFLEPGVLDEDDHPDLFTTFQDSSKSWEWADDTDLLTAFDTLCCIVTTDEALWDDLEATFEDLAYEHADEPSSHLLPVLGAEPTAREYANWAFSRAALLPPPDGTVGEWIHDGTATVDGVSFVAFTALGIEEHLGFALLTDGTDSWVISYSPV